MFVNKCIHRCGPAFILGFRHLFILHFYIRSLFIHLCICSRHSIYHTICVCCACVCSGVCCLEFFVYMVCACYVFFVLLVYGIFYFVVSNMCDLFFVCSFFNVQIIM